LPARSGRAPSGRWNPQLPAHRPLGSRSRASPRRCATCHGNQPAGVQSRSQLDHPRSW